MSDLFLVTYSERDDLKKNYPAQYGQMLELLIAGKVVIVPDNTPEGSR
jgi:hypothetical protein